MRLLPVALLLVALPSCLLAQDINRTVEFENYGFTRPLNVGARAAGLAGAQAAPLAVWLENWRLEAVTADSYRLTAASEGLSLRLQLNDLKGPVLQGERGYSQKGPNPGNASVYYSLTRLDTTGTLSLNGRAFQVNGLSWMDHEYSTSALSTGQVGWDWFSLQLDDGSELMVFQIRRDDGSVDPYSSGTLVTVSGDLIPLEWEDFEIEVLDRWRSPHTGAVYPSRWRVEVPDVGLNLVLEPYLADQELNLSYAYWEGAVRITGERLGREVMGNGYVEMTGYAASMSGQF
jgi:predicted secreted hydrolase